MTIQDIERPVTLNEVGASTVRGKTVGDREKTAQRLLRSSADRAYDAEVDIDWDAPAVPGLYWTTPHRTSLYGTKLWDKLTHEEQIELTKHEAVAVLSFGILVESGLSANLWHQVRELQGTTTDHGRYALAEVSEETRHSTMFGRLINKAGEPPYRYPRFLLRAARLMGSIPLGPSVLAGTLIVEEVLDRIQREAMIDESVQPHVRQLMKIHVLEEARHITYAREELVRQIAERGKISNAMHRFAFALSALVIIPGVYNPKVYKAVGIKPWRGYWAFLTSPRYRENAVFMCEPLMRFLHEIGFLRGRLTGLVLRMSRTLPEDILQDIKSGSSQAA